MKNIAILIVKYILMVYSRYKNKEYVILLNACNALKKNIEKGNITYGDGICWNLRFSNEENLPTNTLYEIFEKWPKFSGEKLYPIAFDGFSGNQLYTSTVDKWTGEYGELRMELFNFMIDECNRVLYPSFKWME